MYELLHFNGGVYKFDDFKEFIEDIGGLIIEMESFKISRGMYFLSEEMNVLIIVPKEEKENVNSFAVKIKGRIESVLMENKEIEKAIIIFEIYKKLQINDSINIDTITRYLLDKPDFININKYSLENIIDKNDFPEEISELLILMEKMNIIEKFKKDNLVHYKNKKL